MNNDDPVTKGDLSTAIKEVKGDLTTAVKELKGDLTTAIKELKDYIDERTHDAETRLLRAFGDYQQAETTRFRHMKADLGNLNVATDERLAAVEQRLTAIDKRLIEKGI